MKETVEVFWFSEQAYGHVSDSDLEKYDSGRLGFPNSFFYLTARLGVLFDMTNFLIPSPNKP